MQIYVLHCFRLTWSFLLCCSALTASRQFFGNNINCMLSMSPVPLPVFESYCFMKSTFTHVTTSNRSAHPGVHGGAVIEFETSIHFIHFSSCYSLDPKPPETTRTLSITTTTSGSVSSSSSRPVSATFPGPGGREPREERSPSWWRRSAKIP